MRDFAGGDLGIQYIAVLLPDQGAASDCATTLVTGATSVQWTPVSRNSSSASPCSVAGTALVTTKCPKPLRSGVVTGRLELRKRLGPESDLTGYALDDRKQVLGAMGQLPHDELKMLLVTLAFGNIRVRLENRDRRSVRTLVQVPVAL